MKKGYSNVYGMLVDANEIDYKDCETYQIVCPECREFLFKRIRRADENRATHYLAHYRADVEANQQCELRVAARFANGPSQEETEAHDQLLGHYLASFSNMLDSLPWITSSEARMNGHRKISASKGTTDLRKALHHGLKTLDIPDFVRGAAIGDPTGGDEGIFGRWDSQRNNLTPRTEFSRSMQIRIAGDMLRTLLTKPAIPAWNELFSAVWSTELAQTEQMRARGEAPHFVERLGPVLVSPFHGQDNRKLLEDLSRRPCHAPYMKSGGSWRDKLFIELMDGIVELLLSIDYSKWAKLHLEHSHTPAAIADSIREEALKRYEKEAEELSAQGIDINASATDEDNRAKAAELDSHLAPMERLKAAVHMAITGEGIELRHTIPAPHDKEMVHPVMLIVRFKKPLTGDYNDAFSVIRRDWKLTGEPMPGVEETMCFHIDHNEVAYGIVSRKVHAIGECKSVDEAMLLLYGADSNITATISDGTEIKFQMLLKQDSKASVH